MTIEHLQGKDRSLHPVQQAFVDKHGIQCGFCTPGMVLSSIALLKENPNPDDAEIREAIAAGKLADLAAELRARYA